MNKLALIITIAAFTTLSACESTQAPIEENSRSTIKQPSKSKRTMANLEYKVIYNESIGSLNSDPDMALRKAESGVITDQETYINKLKQHTNQTDVKPIDFTQQKVIYQTLGWKNHGGEAVIVKDVTDNGSQVSVNLLHVLASCMTTQAFEYSSLFITVNTTKPVNVAMKEVGGCDMGDFSNHK